MFDSALAFARYRREVVRTWPDNEVKDQLLASIECSLRRNGQDLEHLDSRPRSGELDIRRDATIDGPERPVPSEIEQATGA